MPPLQDPSRPITDILTPKDAEALFTEAVTAQLPEGQLLRAVSLYVDTTPEWFLTRLFLLAHDRGFSMHMGGTFEDRTVVWLLNERPPRA